MASSSGAEIADTRLRMPHITYYNNVFFFDVILMCMNVMQYINTYSTGSYQNCFGALVIQRQRVGFRILGEQYAIIYKIVLSRKFRSLLSFDSNSFENAKWIRIDSKCILFIRDLRTKQCWKQRFWQQIWIYIERIYLQEEWILTNCYPQFTFCSLFKHLLKLYCDLNAMTLALCGVYNTDLMINLM